MHPVNADDPAGRTGTRIGSGSPAEIGPETAAEIVPENNLKPVVNLYCEFSGAPGGSTQVARPKETTL